MSNQIGVFLSVAGPAGSVAAWAARMDAARQTFKDGKGSHWGEAFGLCDPWHTIAPKFYDDSVAHNPPPGEAYATLYGFWSSRNWTATEVGLPLGTIASLFPDLTIYFHGEHYEEKAMRGLWIGGKCVVFDVYDPIDHESYIAPENVDRRVHPASPLPDYYAPFFTCDDMPEWDELRRRMEELKNNPAF